MNLNRRSSPSFYDQKSTIQLRPLTVARTFTSPLSFISLTLFFMMSSVVFSPHVSQLFTHICFHLQLLAFLHAPLTMRRTPGQATAAIVYVGLIPFDWTEENFLAVLSCINRPKDYHLGFEHRGKNKGYAFVEYESISEAQRAVAGLSKTLVTPVGGAQRSLRVELSKEGFMPPNLANHGPIQFAPANIPAGVQFPPDVTAQYPQLQLLFQQRAAAVPTEVNGLPQIGRPNAPLPATPFAQQQQQQQQQQQRVNQPSPAPQTVPPGASTTMPDHLVRASQFLPKPTTLPFEKPDKINESLGSIPPPQLIDLIANLKNVLSSQSSARAGDVFNLSPHLAAAAAQALLLMGFVDENVISEAVSASQAQQAPQQGFLAPQHGYQNPQQNYQNQFRPQAGYPQQNAYGDQNQGNYPNHNSGPYQNHPQNQGPYQNQNQGPFQSQNQYPKPNQNRPPQGLPQIPRPPQSQPAAPPPGASKWPHLPLSAQMKLASLPPDQADLVAQVLSLPPDQIGALPPDRQQMVAGIRQQYL